MQAEAEVGSTTGSPSLKAATDATVAGAGADRASPTSDVSLSSPSSRSSRASPNSSAGSSPALRSGAASPTYVGSPSTSVSSASASASSSSPPRSSRRPSMKISLSDVELLEATAAFTVQNGCMGASAELSIALLPHEHSLFCERKERVCQSSGKLQEHEVLRVQLGGRLAEADNLNNDSSHNSSNSSNAAQEAAAEDDGAAAQGAAEAEGQAGGGLLLRWWRSEPEPAAYLVGTDDCVDFVPISEAEGCSWYELTAADVGCYIKCTADVDAGASTGASTDASAIAGEAGGEAETKAPDAGAGAQSQVQVQVQVQVQSCVVLGPVVPAPPRLLETKITCTGEAHTGKCLIAQTSYIGGIEGPSEYWWIRIRNGDRENLSEPMPLTEAEQGVTFSTLSATMAPTMDVGSAAPTAAPTAMTSADPRVHVLTADDAGCTFKLKCRPVRSDGYRGEVFTSKPSNAAV